jgi:hypothetical protein
MYLLPDLQRSGVPSEAKVTVSEGDSKKSVNSNQGVKVTWIKVRFLWVDLIGAAHL